MAALLFGSCPIGRDLLLGLPGGHLRRDLDKTFAPCLNVQEMDRLGHRNVACWKRWRCDRLVRRCAAGRKRTASKQGCVKLGCVIPALEVVEVAPDKSNRPTEPRGFG